MLRKGFGRFSSGIALTLLVTVGSATAQTKCRGYKAIVVFGEACLWGCGEDIPCNCTVGACADGVVVVVT
jgi:hypothetical protein